MLKKLKKKSNSLPPSAPPIKGGYVSINSFGFDAGTSTSPYVELYISLDDVGTVKGSVECDFKKDSFDLTIRGLNGKNYRLLKSNLEHDIVPEDSKFIVKKNKVIVKLKKVKGDYSYDSWQTLTSKKNKEAKKKSKDDPTAGIMDMMKDMYDSGDDQMKKVIGEAMMKSKQGGAGGMGGL
jgi:calcyclin binding protein